MQIVKVRKTSLLSPFSSTDTTFTLVDFVTHKGVALDITDFDDLFVVVIRQGNLVEMVLCDAITQNADGSATIAVATNGRDLSATLPYTGGTEGEDFGSGAEVVNGDDPYTMYQITIAYADALAIAGVPDASTTVKGGIEIATEAELIAQTATGGTGAALVPRANSPLLHRLVQKRVTTEVSSATPTINTDNCDVHRITALAVNITSFTTNLTGTPYDWEIKAIEIISTGNYTIAWGAGFEDGDVFNLPLSVTTGQKLKCFFNWNGSKWALIGFA